MAFDDVPEDLERSEPCNCGGKITELLDGSGVWECDTCDWSSGPNYIQAAAGGLCQTALEY